MMKTVFLACLLAFALADDSLLGTDYPTEATGSLTNEGNGWIDIMRADFHPSPTLGYDWEFVAKIKKWVKIVLLRDFTFDVTNLSYDIAPIQKTLPFLGVGKYDLGELSVDQSKLKLDLTATKLWVNMKRRGFYLHIPCVSAAVKPIVFNAEAVGSTPPRWFVRAQLDVAVNCIQFKVMLVVWKIRREIRDRQGDECLRPIIRAAAVEVDIPDTVGNEPGFKFDFSITSSSGLLFQSAINTAKFWIRKQVREFFEETVTNLFKKTVDAIGRKVPCMPWKQATDKFKEWKGAVYNGACHARKYSVQIGQILPPEIINHVGGVDIKVLKEWQKKTGLGNGRRGCGYTDANVNANRKRDVEEVETDPNAGTSAVTIEDSCVTGCHGNDCCDSLPEWADAIKSRVTDQNGVLNTVWRWGKKLIGKRRIGIE